VATRSTKTKKGHLYSYDYYSQQQVRPGPDACANSYVPRASELEAPVWDLVSGLLKDPYRLRVGLEKLIEKERQSVRGNPDKGAETWAKQLVEMNRKRSAYQDQQAEWLITLDELRTKLAALEETRAITVKELEALRSRREQIERLEYDADALLEHYAGMVLETLNDLTSKERHSIYKMLRRRVVVSADRGECYRFCEN
jgi:hypothetical protein